MISSMQRNKKWLLPTIWISTIAFVGAGFVGWGSYTPSTSGSSVAVVGSKEISLKDLQQEYSNLYSNYQQSLGKQFNDEMASQLNLQKVAYDNIVQRHLLLNLSDEIGFTVSNEDIYTELLKISSFLKDGKFDEKTYKSLLKQNRTTPSDFEEQIKKNILVTKIQNMFAQNVNDNTMKSLNEVFFANDRIKINIIDSKDFRLNINKEDINKFYEKNKQNYKSIEKFEVNVEKIKIGDDEKKSKKIALKKYLKLKKATAKFSNKETLDANVDYLSIQEQEDIFTSTLGSILKPIRVNDDFVIYQLSKKIKPQVLPLEQIKSKLLEDLKAKKTNEILLSKKDDLVKDFIGVDIGYIKKDTLVKINGLNDQETASLVQKVATATSIIDFVQLKDKIVVFKILDSKLAVYDETKNQYIQNTLAQIKTNEALSSLASKLENKYKIISNYKVQ